MNNIINCIFCKIIKGTESATIVYQDENVIMFNDIKPVSTHHFLVCPKQHIRNAKELTPDDKPLVENLYARGKEKLNELGINVQNARFGFHWPPFNSIDHLHLHVIAPVKEMSFIGRLIFKPTDIWFVSPEYVLRKMNDEIIRQEKKDEVNRNCIHKM